MVCGNASEGRTSRGFTLIELLVVIAIIALLIGIVLPALGSAMAAGRKSKNMSNHRQIGLALQLYGDDHGVYMPHKMPEGVHAATGRPKARWHFIIGDYVGRPIVPQGADELNDFLTTNDFPRLDNEIFLDPTQRFEDMRAKQTGNIQVLRCGSYGYNYQYLGNPRTGADGGYSNYPVGGHQILQPYRTVAFADSGGSQVLRTSEGFREHAYTLDPPRLDTAHNGAIEWGHSSGQVVPELRHNGRAIVSWLDGHAEASGLAELGYRVVDQSTGYVEPDTGDNSMFNGIGYDREATE